MLIIQFLIQALWSVPSAWLRGLWFLFTSPLQFVSFMEEYKRFHVHIEFADQVQESGLGRLPRRDRRPIIAEARKQMLAKRKGN